VKFRAVAPIQTTPASPREEYKPARFTLGSLIPPDLERTMDEKLDQNEVAKYLGVSTKTVRALIARGELPPPIRIGRRQFWLKDKFTQWLRDRGTIALQTTFARYAVKGVERRGRPRLPP
jgi:excisionase family DNA binding protein